MVLVCADILILLSKAGLRVVVVIIKILDLRPQVRLLSRFRACSYSLLQLYEDDYTVFVGYSFDGSERPRNSQI